MQIKYIEGTDKIKVTSLGEFKRGIPREVPDKIGKQLLKKTSLKWVEVKDSPTKKESKGGK